MHVNLEQTLMVFLNGRANSVKSPEAGPAKIMFYDQKNNRWSPLRPDIYQAELICHSVNQWHQNRSHHKELTPVIYPVTV